MDKNTLFLELSCNSDLTRLFDVNQIKDLIVALCSRTKNNIVRFFNEISLATANFENEYRIMIPEGTQFHSPGIGDCLAVNLESGVIRSLEFKHWTSVYVQKLPTPKFYDTSHYEILTPLHNKLFFTKQPYVNHVYTYADIQKRMPGYYTSFLDSNRFSIPSFFRIKIYITHTGIDVIGGVYILARYTFG